MNAQTIAKALVGKQLVRSRAEDEHVQVAIGDHVAIGLLTSQLDDLATRPFVIEAETLGLAWGGLICVIDPRSSHVDAFQLAREARTVTAIMKLTPEAAAPIKAGRVAALEVGWYEDRPVDIYVFAEPTLEQLRARCGPATVLPRPTA